MLISLSTSLDPTPEQVVLLDGLWASVALLHQRVQTYLNARGGLSWPAALQGHSPAAAPGASVAPRLGAKAMLEVFHALRPHLLWSHAAPQTAYDAIIRAAVREPAAACQLRLDAAVHLVDPVTVLIAPLGCEARVLGRPYLLPTVFWAALVDDAYQRHAHLEGLRDREERLWLAGDAEAGRRLLGHHGRSILRRSALPLPTLVQSATFRRRETTLEQRPDGWWVIWSFEADAAALPCPQVHDAVGCDPGQHSWAALASGQGSRFIPSPRLPPHLPDSLPSRGWMSVPTDLRRARAELAYHIAEAARPQRDELLNALLAYDTVGVEDVDWQGLEQRRFSFSTYAAATGLRAVLDTATELGPQLGCVVIRTPSRLSSRMCSACGRVAPGRGYGRRSFHCPRCGLTVDRDINAARNHRRAALEAVGT